VSLTVPGEGTPAYEFTPTTDESGHFTLTGIEAGTYEVRVKQAHTLQNVQTVTLAGGSNTTYLGVLREGDANDDNFIIMIDFSILAATFGVCEGTDGYDERADGGGDGCILMIDFSLLASNFGQGGDNLQMTAPKTSQTSDVAMGIDPVSTRIEPGGTFDVAVVVETGTQQVDGAQIALTFDPTILQVEGLTAGEALNLELASQFDNERGSISFAAGTLSNFPSGSLNVVQIRFKAFTAGESTLSFAQAGFALSLPKGVTGSDVTFGGASVLGEVMDGEVTVSEPTAITVSSLQEGEASWLWAVR
jgi:hypothetical protein